VKRVDLAYTAGIVDGEGCIEISRSNRPGHRYPNHYLRVTVVSTDQWLCEWLHFSYGGSIQERLGHPSHTKRQWGWVIQNTKALEFLKLILPYLHIKQPQAEIGIKHQEGKKKSTRELTDAERAVHAAERLLLQNMKRDTGMLSNRVAD